MNEKRINILWIDDQHEELLPLHSIALDYGITLFPYKSMNGGCKELEKNYSFYDAILLDAKFFEDEDDSPGSEDTKWVHKTKDRILQLPKKFEYFILTGQSKTYASEEFNNAFPYVYEKGNSEAQDELFNKLLLAADRQADNQIIYKYKDAFEVAKEDLLGDIVYSLLLKALRITEGFEDFYDDPGGSLNDLRLIIEQMFTKMNSLKLLPDEIYGNINYSSKFISGKLNDQYDLFEQIAPPTIGYLLQTFLGITQDGSHLNDKLNLKVNEHIYNQKTSYLYKSVVYQLLDIIVWFKEYVNSKPKTYNWKKIELVNIYKGVIEQDANRNYFCGEYLLPYNHVNENYTLGQTIVILRKDENTKPYTKDKYPYRATNFELKSKE